MADKTKVRLHYRIATGGKPDEEGAETPEQEKGEGSQDEKK